MDSESMVDKISIVMPACNEEGKLGGTLESYARYFSGVDARAFQLIVVCNGCTDNTPQVARDVSERFPQIKVVNYPERIGKGGAIREGFRMADGDIIGFVDADGAIRPEESWKLIQIVSQGGDGAIGSRHVPGAQVLTPKPLHWRFASWSFNIIVRLLFQLPFRDTQCGVKVFRRQVIQSIINNPSINGMSFDVELLWRAKKHGYEITEVGIVWEHKPKNGMTNNLPKTIARMATEIMKLRFGSRN